MMESPILLIQVIVIVNVEILVSSQTAHATYSVKVTEHIHAGNPIDEDISLCGLSEAFRCQETVVRQASTGALHPCSTFLDASGRVSFSNLFGWVIVTLQA